MAHRPASPASAGAVCSIGYGRHSDGQHASYGRGVGTGDVDRLVSRRQSVHEGQTRLRHVERVRDGTNDGLVRGMIHRRGRDSDEQSAIAQSAERRARRSGDHADLDAAARWRLTDEFSAHAGGAGRAPKMAEPTRTIVAPSSIATSKSWLMPIESSARSAAGMPRVTSSSLRARS